MTTLRGTLLLPHGAASGSLEFAERIERVDARRELAEPTAPFVLPGFIDVHVHGGGGGDAMDGVDGVRRLARFHAGHGTTTLLPTTMTNPWPSVIAALRGVAELVGSSEDGLPDVLGAHLEGPFINPGRLGAQPPATLPPEPDLVNEVLALEVVRVVTLAPEVEGALQAAETFARAGVRVSFGHTLATADQATEGVDAVLAAGGTAGFTHLYNAMTPLASREPGAVGVALARPEAYAELILDLHHVHAVAFRAAHAAKGDRLLLITDAMRAAGSDGGASELGGQAVYVDAGAARLADGTLAGSVLTMDQAVKNAVSSGLGLTAAVRAATAVPADYLGLGDRGRLEVGARGDVVVLDDDLHVIEVYARGRRLV